MCARPLNRWYCLLFDTIVPIVPNCTKGSRYNFERLSVGISIFFELYQLYLTFKNKKNKKNFFIEKRYTIGYNLN